MLTRLFDILMLTCLFDILLVWLLYGVLRNFQQYFSYIVAVRFTGGGNRSIRRKPPTCRK
jgi:hypothetical protein